MIVETEVERDARARQIACGASSPGSGSSCGHDAGVEEQELSASSRLADEPPRLQAEFERAHGNRHRRAPRLPDNRARLHAPPIANCSLLMMGSAAYCPPSRRRACEPRAEQQPAGALGAQIEVVGAAAITFVGELDWESLNESANAEVDARVERPIAAGDAPQAVCPSVKPAYVIGV